jgi:hypothetical protein
LLCGDTDTTFKRVRETLTRSGNIENNSIIQSCHIFHKRGKYYITHHKNMIHMDKGLDEITESDLIDQNSVAYMLKQWGMIDSQHIQLPKKSNVKVIKHIDLKKWNLTPKYKIGSISSLS